MENKNYQYLSIHKSIEYEDGVYNGKYNGEPALIRMSENKAVFITFMGFFKYKESGEQISTGSNIYNPDGIRQSDVELLLQESLILKKID